MSNREAYEQKLRARLTVLGGRDVLFVMAAAVDRLGEAIAAGHVTP